MLTRDYGAQVLSYGPEIQEFIDEHADGVDVDVYCPNCGQCIGLTVVHGEGHGDWEVDWDADRPEHACLTEMSIYGMDFEDLNRLAIHKAGRS